MPMHKGILPREGLCADVILKLVRRTLLNPNLLLPLILLARYTKKGRDLSILHPKAARRLRLLFYVAVARGLSGWFSDRVRNNWVSDRYDWSKEIVLITGGAAGLGAAMVKLLDEIKVRVVVLDVQRMTYAACKSTPCRAGVAIRPQLHCIAGLTTMLQPPESATSTATSGRRQTWLPSPKG